MSRTQLNVRVSDELEKAIDAKRVELLAKLGAIPTRSDILRMALETYLGITLTDADADRRSTTGPEKRKAARSGTGNSKPR